MSSAGRCIARSTSSGIVVGPGIARNSRPARTVIFYCPCWRIQPKSCTARRLLPGRDRQEKVQEKGQEKGQERGEKARKQLLSFGFTASGRFGVLDRAEPARAL